MKPSEPTWDVWVLARIPVTGMDVEAVRSHILGTGSLSGKVRDLGRDHRILRIERQDVPILAKAREYLLREVAPQDLETT